MVGTPFIPKTIVVHLGTPSSAAENVYVSFPDYIKNVASGEIYPTWPDAALRANIYAQISYALNRYYTEWYRSQGYDLDITNSTQFDQSYKPGREIYDSVSNIVDEIFNSYVVKQGSIEPYFTQYCNGTTSTCDGLSQWGTVPLAQEGLGAYDILTRFYGDDIDIITNAPVRNGQPSYPGRALRLGDSGNDVQQMQIRLNRISTNYPNIPKINPTDGNFSVDTEAAVRAFQRTFRLTEDGIIGNATWYRTERIYNAVKRLNELTSEGISLSEVTAQYNGSLSEGDSGSDVINVQYLLSYLSAFFNFLPSIAVDGLYGPSTAAAVRAFQEAYALPVTGEVDLPTWDALWRTYLGFVETIPLSYTEGVVVPYPGVPLRFGASSDAVRLLQEYLNYLAQYDPALPSFPVTGYYGSRTQEAVNVFQRTRNLEVTGTVGAATWNAITEEYRDLYLGNQLREGQYPGFDIGGTS